MKIKLDSWITGVILGFIAPLICLLTFKRYKPHDINTIDFFIKDFFLDKQYRSLLSSFLSFTLLANAIFFAVLIQFNKYKIGTGVFITTLILGITLLLFKTFS